jgi:hypothetical protein
MNLSSEPTLLDPEAIYYPDPEMIAPLAIQFACLMFAHAHFEAEFRALQSAITNDPSFGEQPANQWSARQRPDRMIELIKKHFPAGLAEAEPITALLTEAIAHCDRRNLLAHGEWWCFHPPTSTVTVRSGVQWQPERPEHKDFTADDICAVTEALKELRVRLYHLRSSIEARNDAP